MENSRRTGRRIAALALVAACGGGKAKTPPRAGKVISAILEAAAKETAPWRCAALDTPTAPDEELATGEHKWKLSGQTIARAPGDPEIVIGVVADAAGSAPRTIAALSRLRAKLDAAHPDLVIALGGMGRTAAELEASLGTLGERATWPTIALPGDLEDVGEHVAAITALRKRGLPILDGHLVRWIDAGGATIATIPGASARERLVAGGDGCGWTPGDVAAVYDALTAKAGVRIAASAEAPRQTLDGEPAGELGLAPPKPIEIALHGPLRALPSPAATGARDGAKIALSPGTSDATTRLPGGHVASAGLLVVRGTSWSWRPVVDGP